MLSLTTRAYRLCFLVLVIAGTSASAQSPFFPDAALLELECAAVGDALTVVHHTDAASRAVGAGVFFTDDAPGDDASTFIRLTIPEVSVTGDYLLNFRRRNTVTGQSGPLWIRTNGGQWERLLAGFSAEDWAWELTQEDYASEPTYPSVRFVAGTGNTLDIAFSQANDQLDKLYFDYINTEEIIERLHPFGTTVGNNCPGFTNRPPVAKLANQGWERVLTGRESSYLYIDARQSFDPDGDIIQYSYVPDNSRRDLDLDDAEVLVEYKIGDVPVSVTVTDFYGGTDGDTIIFRGVPNIPTVERTSFRLSGACFDGPVVTPLSFDLDVMARNAGAYHLTGKFSAANDKGNCLSVRINGGEWQKWAVIEINDGFYSYYPGSGFTFSPGNNTVEIASCSPGLTIEELLLSPDTQEFQQAGSAHRIEDLACPGGPDTTAAEYAWLEAECADYGSAWTTGEEPTAANGTYLVVTNRNSLSAPPAATPANLLSFSLAEVSLAAGDPVYLYARIDAPSRADDSFWVRLNDGSWYAWKLPKPTAEGYLWYRLPAELTASGGINTLDFTYREDGTRLDRVYVSTTDELPGDAPAVGSNCAPVTTVITLEAECGDLTQGWVARTSTAASGSYVFFAGARDLGVPIGNGTETITYALDVVTAGTYTLFGRVDAPDPGRNSVWVRVDDGPWLKWWRELDGTQLLTDGFAWRTVNDNTTATTVDLEAGSHTLRVANRESGTRLDKLQLSLSGELPTGLGAAATNCENSSPLAARPATRTAGQSAREAEASLSLFPNPTTGRLTVESSNDYAGPVHIVVYDMTGRRVLSATHTKTEGPFRTEVSVFSLPSGVYRLQLLAGDRAEVRAFTKR